LERKLTTKISIIISDKFKKARERKYSNYAILVGAPPQYRAVRNVTKQHNNLLAEEGAMEALLFFFLQDLDLLARRTTDLSGASSIRPGSVVH